MLKALDEERVAAVVTGSGRGGGGRGGGEGGLRGKAGHDVRELQHQRGKEGDGGGEGLILEAAPGRGEKEVMR